MRFTRVLSLAATAAMSIVGAQLGHAQAPTKPKEIVTDIFAPVAGASKQDIENRVELWRTYLDVPRGAGSVEVKGDVEDTGAPDESRRKITRVTLTVSVPVDASQEIETKLVGTFKDRSRYEAWRQGHVAAPSRKGRSPGFFLVEKEKQGDMYVFELRELSYVKKPKTR
jgi:hypothetical protein